MTVNATNDVACPHYLPTVLGSPTVICLGCGGLVADHRHPQNQAVGVTAPVMVQRPELRQQPRSSQRKT